MEVDRLLYIFGSFSRKRQEKRKSLQQQQSKSAGSSPQHRAPSQLHLAVPPRTSAYEPRGSLLLKEWQCPLCRRELVEPRLLGCLHSCCTRCLQGLRREGDHLWGEEPAPVQPDPGGSRSESGAGSAGSGYESELRDTSGSEPDGSWAEADKPLKYGIFTRKISGCSVQLVVCPSCGLETPLPLGGIAALPLNYVLLRKMVLAGHDQGGRASVLCDLCNSDTKAESRCGQCLVSVCSSCGEAHGRQKATARHSLHALDPGPARFCSQHPKAELSVYCATCQQVICRDCCVVSHAGHALANARLAAAERARLLRDACDRARRVPDHVDRLSRALDVQAVEVDNQSAQVESEVSEWAEQYRRAVETHSRALCTAAARARARYRLKFMERANELEARSHQAQHAVSFAEEVLAEAKEEELLSLSGPVLRRLEKVCELSPLAAPPKCELRFASGAPAGAGLAGRLLTRAPDPATCVLHTDGLQDLRVNCSHEIIVELRDSSGERVWSGGEQVAGYFRRSDSNATPHMAKVTDREDGTYALVITPPSPGAYLLAVTLNNKPIKDSPFPCAARVWKAHTGQFHCCTFCSSGGRKDATCGCGGSMGGGYKGCGHGYAGHPGAKHWSCCGSTERRSVCTRRKSHTYQFSL